MTGIDDIRAAQQYLHGRVHRTPLIATRTLGERIGATLLLKAETFQRTGSFKVRGVLNRLRHLTPGERARGLVTVSAGNHAQAVAYAAALEGIRATVVMPEHAVQAKVDASRAYGADVVLHGDVFAAFARMEELREERGLTLVHPFDDPDVIAGQGTVGLEICEDLPDVDVVVVPVGGGGLIGGVSAAVRALRPEARIVGVEPTGSAALTRGLAEGAPVRLARSDTIADGLGAPMTGPNALAHARAFVDEVVLVGDDDIAAALRAILERCKVLVEPAGAAAVAALLSGAVSVPPGARVVAVLSGGNIDLQRLRQLLAS
ncbi:MAG TPA: threonine/serine dehydratase [Longimicrobiales bacterium]|nr:threonine/serine dehydratase [Longimicrobiales bacterium]